MNRTLVIVAGVTALISLAVNIAFDFEQLYDMTMAALPPLPSINQR
ncbi:MAG: hypothetical protein ACRECH_07795 [Nitrososphaerales archaeon]